MPHKTHSEGAVKLKSALFLSVLMITLFLSSITKAQDKVYTLDSVKTIPTYKGGMVLMYKYLAHNIRYPGDAVTNNIQGKVHVSFIVEKDGKLSDVKVESGPGYGLNEEALRVIKKSPAWTPGYINDMPVRTKYSMPISFTLN